MNTPAGNVQWRYCFSLTLALRSAKYPSCRVSARVGDFLRVGTLANPPASMMTVPSGAYTWRSPAFLTDGASDPSALRGAFSLHLLAKFGLGAGDARGCRGTGGRRGCLL